MVKTTLMSLVSGLLTMVLITQPVLVSANEICFSEEKGNKVKNELKYCKDKINSDGNVIIKLNEKSEKLFQLSEEYKKKVGLLEQDKVDLKTRGDQFEQVYVTCSQDLNKCKEEKPSRFIWFGVGFLTAIALGVTTVIMAK